MKYNLKRSILAAILLPLAFTSHSLGQTFSLESPGGQLDKDRIGGAGLTFTSIDNDTYVDMIKMVYANPPSNGNDDNYFLINIGELDSNSGWSGKFRDKKDSLPLKGPTNNPGDAGIAVTNLDDDPNPEVFFMAYDNSGSGSFIYQIGENANKDFKIKDFGHPIHVPDYDDKDCFK